MEQTELDWILRFILSELPFSQHMKLLKQARKMDECIVDDPQFVGRKALRAFLEYQTDTFLSFEPRILLGHLANGAQSDHGTIVHAVPNGRLTAYCGAKPSGKRSVGWSDEPKDQVSCPKCIKCVEKLHPLSGSAKTMKTH